MPAQNFINNGTFILGAGITGLSAGYQKNIPIFEAQDSPGGICSSYYLGLDNKKTQTRTSEESYRFENGGGHWIFGAEPDILKLLQAITPLQNYERKACVFFPQWNLYVPYPLQNHLRFLPEDLKKKALSELAAEKPPLLDATLDKWLEKNFGKTLCDLFFFPFHNLYTAGLHTQIAPQDHYKSPVNQESILKGACEATLAAGYNTYFCYPTHGLDTLIQGFAQGCCIHYKKKILQLDPKAKILSFADGTSQSYGTLISTLPLDQTLRLSGLDAGKPDPYTSVLVVNLGGEKGPRCPDAHWAYVPQSCSGFHRIGFYSNVDPDFLPLSARNATNKVSLYVEKSYPGGNKPTDPEIQKTTQNIVRELKDWGIITNTDVVSPTWVETAYTWRYPESHWVETGIELLRKSNIIQAGRYAKWKFQGIAESIRDGRDTPSEFL